MMDMLGTPISVEAAQAHINRVDANGKMVLFVVVIRSLGDGKMDFYEFLDYLGF